MSVEIKKAVVIFQIMVFLYQLMIGVASKGVEPDDNCIRMLGRARSPEEMEALGQEAAASVAAGAVIALVGGLGAGKTHWCKGFVAGMGSAAEVTSPTFGLVHEYPGGRLQVFHFDFYRLDSPEELLALGWDEYLDAEGVILAEWGDKFPELLPPESVWIQFGVEADGSRTLRQ